MKAPHAGTLRDRAYNPKDAYGPLKRNKNLEDLFWMEDLLDAIAPLPTTYDVQPLNAYQFNEYTYTDFWDGILISTLSWEVNARVLDKIELSTNTIDIIQSDKYSLMRPLASAERIIFLPGSNLLHAIDWPKVERLLYYNDDIMVKPHPIMTQEGLRLIAAKIGFNRILDPDYSGFELLKHCKQMWCTANSEMGLRAIMLGIPWEDVSDIRALAHLPLAHFYRILAKVPNAKTVGSLFNSPLSGYMPASLSREEFIERAKIYFDESLKWRELFKPAYPQHVNIEFDREQH